MRVAIVTQDVIGDRLAGPAIRALAMGRQLAGDGHDVRVASADDATHDHELVVGGGLGSRQARDLAAWADVVVVQGDVLVRRPALGSGDGTLVCDLYDPVEMEGLVRGVELPEPARYAATRGALASISAQLARGDLFLCASERQRLFWLGHLDSAGRVNAATFDRDPTLRDLLAVVPFGLPDEAPVRDGPGLVDRVEGLEPGLPVVLWGGGVYDWLDPLPFVEAMPEVVRQVPGARLVFMGTKHPNPAVPSSSVLRRTRARVAELDLGRVVLFHEGWVPYQERHNVLLDAAVGVSGHRPHVETALAFRTRVLDYLWAGLPVVTTAGDALGDLVEAEGLGAAVPPSDPAAVTAALVGLLTDDARAEAARLSVAAVAARMRWSAVLGPLRDHCRDPRPAADRDVALARQLRADRAPGRSEARARARELAQSVRSTVDEGGLALLAAKARRRLTGRRA